MTNDMVIVLYKDEEKKEWVAYNPDKPISETKNNDLYECGIGITAHAALDDLLSIEYGSNDK